MAILLGNITEYPSTTVFHQEAIETLSSCWSSITSAMVTAPTAADNKNCGDMYICICMYIYIYIHLDI